VSEILTSRFAEAMHYAWKVHRAEDRKGTRVPYMAHLLGTAGIVLAFGGDEEQGIAGLLHDAPENQGGRDRLADIEARFGSRVARMVEGCTDTLESPKPPWKVRKQRHLARLGKETADTLLVCAADKLDNARAIVMDVRVAIDRGGLPGQDRIWARFKGEKEGTLWYYLAMIETLRRALGGPIVHELELTVQEMHALASR
jgi:(p)ppGpp synthase/HD superfamily hydrolase